MSFTRLSNVATRSKSFLSCLRRPPCLPLGTPAGADETHTSPARTQLEHGFVLLHLTLRRRQRLQLGWFVFRIEVRVLEYGGAPEGAVACSDDGARFIENISAPLETDCTA